MKRVTGVLSVLVILLLSLLLCLGLLAGCSRNQLQDNQTTIVTPPSDQQTRPDIPRTNITESRPTTNENPNGAIIRSFLNSTTVTVTVRGERGLIAGNSEDPFLLGKRLGDLIPLLTRHDLTLLASKQPSLNGWPLRAESYLRFDFEENSSGILRITRDKKTERPLSELFFEEGKPIFEYAYLLQDGAFPILAGQELELFGHTYILKKATNTTVELYGKDTEQYLILENDSELSLNGKEYTETSVEVDPWHFTITYYAPDIDTDGLSLSKGETLRKKLRSPEMLLNPLFDIAYDGLEESPLHHITLRAMDDVLAVNCTVASGGIELPLIGIQNGILVWGDDETLLHLQECNDYCIGLKDKLLLLTKEGVAIPLQFRGVDDHGDEAVFSDPSGERHIARLADTKRREGNNSVREGTLGFGRTLFRFELLFNESRRDQTMLMIDQDGDGAISNEEIPLVLLDGYELQFPEENQSNDQRIVVLVAPKLPRHGLNEERLPLRVVREGRSLLVGLAPEANVTLHQIEDDESWEGVMSRGIGVRLEESRDGVLGEELQLVYPQDYRAGIVRIIG